MTLCRDVALIAGRCDRGAGGARLVLIAGVRAVRFVRRALKDQDGRFQGSNDVCTCTICSASPFMVSWTEHG